MSNKSDKKKLKLNWNNKIKLIKTKIKNEINTVKQNIIMFNQF